MEFILVSGPGVEKCLPNLQNAIASAPLLAPVDGPLLLKPFKGLVVASNGGDKIGGKRYLWDGHGVVGRKCFSSGLKNQLPAEVESYATAHITGAINSSDLRGVFTLIEMNEETGAFTVVLDPLYQYPLFIHKIDNTLLVSNNIYVLEAAAKVFGARLKRTATVGAYETAFGIGAAENTGFQGVTMLPSGQFIKGQGARWSIKSSRYVTVDSNKSYRELMASAADRLCNYMIALDQSSEEGGLLFDLTGGQDSRLCFAAALAAGLKNITVFSGGDADDGDKQVAYQLALKFGAKAGNYPENYAGRPVTAGSLAKRAVFRQQGCSTLYHYSLGTVRLSRLHRVRGGAGELARSFISPPTSNGLFWESPKKRMRQFIKANPVYRASMKAYWQGLYSTEKRSAARWAERYCNGNKALRALYTKDFMHRGVASVAADLSRHTESVETMGMDIYLKDRSRRHVGYTSRGYNLSCGGFEPLLDPVILAAAEALSWEERVNGKLIFDLIEHLGGRELLKVPFVKQSVTEGQINYLSAHLGVSKESLQYQNCGLPEVERQNILTACHANVRHETIPEGLGMHASYLWRNKTYFRELAESIGEDNDCWQIFDREELLEAIRSETFFYQNNTYGTRGLRLLHTLIWLVGDEDPVGISSEI